MEKHIVEAKEIFELSKRLSDPAQAQNDMAEAMGLVTKMLRERYVNRIGDVLAKIQERSRKEPPKEVALLNAVKPFMRAEAHAGIDKMAEMLLLADVFTKMHNAAGEVHSSGALIHEDGVYEVDEECMKNNLNKS